MKILSGVLITIYLISTISGIDCQKNSEKCTTLNKKCLSHKDCCSKDCSYSYLWFNKYCREKNDFWFIVKTLVRMTLNEDQMETCTYKPDILDYDNTTEASNEPTIKASHLKFPNFFKVIIKFKEKYLEVRVDDEVDVMVNQSVIVLSKKTADLLDIKSGDTVPCIIKLPHIDSVFIKHFFKYWYPFFAMYLYVLMS